MYRQSETNLLKSNTSSTRADNMVNFGPLTAEIRWQVWGTPANFNGFRVLAALLHGTLAEGATYIWQGDNHVGHWPTFLVGFSFFIILFCSVPCGRLSWLLVSFWALVNIANRIVSYICIHSSLFSFLTALAFHLSTLSLGHQHHPRYVSFDMPGMGWLRKAGS